MDIICDILKNLQLALPYHPCLFLRWQSLVRSAMSYDTVRKLNDGHGHVFSALY